jgi:hypothetical protein
LFSTGTSIKSGGVEMHTSDNTPSKERKNIWKYYFYKLSRSQSQNELKYSVYVRVDILLPFGQHMHDRITSLRGEVSVHKAISTVTSKVYRNNIFKYFFFLSKVCNQRCVIVE